MVSIAPVHYFAGVLPPYGQGVKTHTCASVPRKFS